MRRIVLVLAALLWLASGWATVQAQDVQAQDVQAQDAVQMPQADRDAIRGIIQRQIEAFKRDDAATAFDFAAPSIQQMFQNADTFIGMVRRAYPPVYRPRDIAFGDLVTIDGMLVQKVELVGPDGEAVLALYSMEKQPDGRWRISGCSLTRSQARAV
ncbi:MAG TPA: DUF4864 domain-containing protein [Stellaceae bacterium]|nr:DUF4864 domain-containing protein [Stellaceae bacterium]